MGVKGDRVWRGMKGEAWTQGRKRRGGGGSFGFLTCPLILSISFKLFFRE